MSNNRSRRLAVVVEPPPPSRLPVENFRARYVERGAAREALLAAFAARPFDERRSAAAAVAEELASLLPCADPDVGELDIPYADELGACSAVEAWKSCPFFSPNGEPALFHARTLDVFCHRGYAIASDRQQAELLERANVPRRYWPVLRAALPAREAMPRGSGELDQAPAVPLLVTDALKVARAFIGGIPAKVELTGAARTIDVRGDERFLVMAGTVGTGKSFAAAWVIARKGGRWYRAADLCRIRDDFDPDEAASFKGPIVIDDLGQEHAGVTEYALATVDRILGARYDANRRTVITTNLSRAALGQRYGERLLDRLAEVAVFAPLVGDSLRGRR